MIKDNLCDCRSFRFCVINSSLILSSKADVLRKPELSCVHAAFNFLLAADAGIDRIYYLKSSKLSFRSQNSYSRGSLEQTTMVLLLR